jgi:hypothetical protein
MVTKKRRRDEAVSRSSSELHQPPQAKRARYATLQPVTRLTGVVKSVPDAVLCLIFHYLYLDELVDLSQTCWHLRKLVNTHVATFGSKLTLNSMATWMFNKYRLVRRKSDLRMPLCNGLQIFRDLFMFLQDEYLLTIKNGQLQHVSRCIMPSLNDVSTKLHDDLNRIASRWTLIVTANYRQYCKYDMLEAQVWVITSVVQYFFKAEVKVKYTRAKGRSRLVITVPDTHIDRFQRLIQLQSQ